MNSTDLKQIGKLLDEKLESRLSPIEKRLGGVERRLDEHGKILKQHSKVLKSLKKDQDTILKVLDGEQMAQQKRIKRVEDHLDLPPLAS